MSSIKSFFGDKAFYKRAFALAVPVMLQQGITNFVSLLDNIMVGRICTEAMSGVSIVNQFVFIFNLIAFGIFSGAGIYVVQFHGNHDENGIRYSFRFKIISSFLVTALGVVIFGLLDDQLINTFLTSTKTEGDLALTLSYGKEYLSVMLIGLLPYVISQAYASTLRETEHSVLPMIASICAVLTNLALNWILIFGNFGMRAMGVKGAAIATVISRFIELAILVVWTHANKEKCPFIRGAFRSLTIPGALVGSLIIKGLPLMANEFFWSTSMTLRNQCYSTKGIEAIAAQNISSTIMNVVSVVYMSFGTAISIMVGAQLGAGEIDEAKKTSKKLLTCSAFCGLIVGLFMVATSGIFPMLYKTGQNVRDLASAMMIISGIFMAFNAFSHSSYFCIRAGGNVVSTFIMDSGFMWLVVIPTVLIFTHCTNVNIITLYCIGQGCEVIKIFFAIYLFKKTNWTKRLVSK
jgi:putative MATE family efflux protein